MIVYHETNPDMLEPILANGLKRTTRGEKGSDTAIIWTDHLLDANLPDKLRRSGVSRDNNVYGYLTAGYNVVDIRDGALIPLSRKARNPSYVLLPDGYTAQTLLRLQFGYIRCCKVGHR